ncbi:MAG: hypothetical protein MUF07_11250 [Steroidobacteraceae bacterium]|nr:hypothetical protein [Steroidobacteraceae bacterium]
MNTPTDRDDEFESAVRARRRFVPRFDDADDAEPSPELDRIVLARARDATRPVVPARPDTRERHWRGPRWAVPLALVATVLLSFTLVLQLDPARNEAVPAPRAAAPAVATTKAAVEAASDAAPVVPPAMPAPTPATQPSSAPARAVAPPVMAAAEADASMAPAEASRGTAAQARSTASAAPGSDVASIPDMSDPDAWLDGIERLRRNGELDAVRTELAAFERRFPGHPLPDALRALRTDAAR